MNIPVHKNKSIVELTMISYLAKHHAVKIQDY